MFKNQKVREGTCDVEEEEIEDQDGGNGNAVYMEENNRPKNRGNDELRYCFILRNFSPFMCLV